MRLKHTWYCWECKRTTHFVQMNDGIYYCAGDETKIGCGKVLEKFRENGHGTQSKPDARGG